MFTINDVGTHRQINGELVALTEDERAAIRDKWNAPDTRPYDEKRREAYDAAGCTISALAIATFESVFADDSSAAVKLQIEREKIKAAIPK